MDFNNDSLAITILGGCGAHVVTCLGGLVLWWEHVWLRVLDKFF